MEFYQFIKSKKFNKKWIAPLFIFGAFYSFAQTPGGVSSNVQLWLKADAGVTGTTIVTGWDDQSGKGYNANAGNGPELVNNSINFNPALQFVPGSSEYMQITGGIFANGTTYNDNFTYVMNRTNGTANPKQYAFRYITSDATPDQFMATIPWGPNNLYYDFGDNATDKRIAYTLNPTVLNVGEPYFFSFGSSTGTSTPSGTRKSIYQNGSLKISSSNPADNLVGDNTATLYIGSQDGTQLFHNGDMAEMIVLTAVPSNEEHVRIQSYLAIKYGITHTNDNDGDATTGEAIGAFTEGDYLASDGTVIWDYSVNSAYHNDVAGIGQDNNSGLVQSKSMSVNTGSVLLMKSPSSLDDMDFLVCGDNGTSLATKNTVDVPTGYKYDERLARVWRADKTGSPGTATLKFYLGGMAGRSTFASDYALLINSTTTFAGVIPYTAGLSYNNDTITFTGVTLNDGDYFTLATGHNCSLGYEGPAGVGKTDGSSELVLWLKANSSVYNDAGTTPATNGQSIQQWNDLSGNANHVTQTVAGDKPTYVTGEINSQPVVRFDGISEILDGPSTNALIGENIQDITTFTVYKTTSTTRSYLWSMKRDAGIGSLISADINSNGGTATSGYTSFLSRDA
ncbi:hypothetical protein N9R81_01400, partial [Flavobacteriales bacterium]|nr:hypothetical protein [Flavobacteriales bacterium]